MCFNCIFAHFIFLCTCILYTYVDKSAMTSIKHSIYIDNEHTVYEFHMYVKIVIICWVPALYIHIWQKAYFRRLATRCNDFHRPFTRYAKWRVLHAPGMLWTFSPSPRVSNPDLHHDTGVTHVPWSMTGSLTSGFLWFWYRGKRFRYCRCMRN